MISVVIPLYNKEQCIRKTIDSVLQQVGFSDFEIVVVDDGSTDRSCEIVESIDDNRIVLFHKKNGGPASARNHGVRHARGEWIIFLDADDYFLPEALSLFSSYSLRFPDYSCFSANFYVENKNKRRLNSYLMRTGPCKDPFKKRQTKQFSCRTGAAMFRKSVLVEFQFDEKLRRLEDAEVNFRIMRSYSFFIISQPVMIYNQDTKEASLACKNPTLDYLTHLKPSNGSFWERVVMYMLYKQACLLYPKEAKTLYSKKDFVSYRYFFAVWEIKMYLKFNNLMSKILKK